jgi:hypothetical protein
MKSLPDRKLQIQVHQCADPTDTIRGRRRRKTGPCPQERPNRATCIRLREENGHVQPMDPQSARSNSQRARRENKLLLSKSIKTAIQAHIDHCLIKQWKTVSNSITIVLNSITTVLKLLILC